MHRLGFTRSAHQASHLLLTPDSFVRAPLPGMQKATAIMHVSPAIGAGFTQYTAEFERGGRLGAAHGQRFVYVLDGDLRVDEYIVDEGEYAYLPEGSNAVVTAAGAARAVVIEKAYVAIEGVAAPAMIVSHDVALQARPFTDDADLEVLMLLPEQPAFDFAVNIMTFQPGAALPTVESHVMEHGLLMLAGGGIYRLGDNWYPVTAGDFIWMAPWCPQWFGALGKAPAKYLIYKDWNR
jgi:(S)-ureidoglycine aminohydrolase